MDGEDICYRYRVAICPALNRPVKLARDFVGHERSGTAYSYRTFEMFSFSLAVHHRSEVCHIHPLPRHLLRSQLPISSSKCNLRPALEHLWLEWISVVIFTDIMRRNAPPYVQVGVFFCAGAE